MGRKTFYKDHIEITEHGKTYHHFYFSNPLNVHPLEIKDIINSGVISFCESLNQIIKDYNDALERRAEQISEADNETN